MSRGKETDGNFTFACNFVFKARRIFEGDLDLLPIFTSPVVVLLQFLKGKSFSKSLSRRIALLNLLSTALDVLFPASAADFNALSAAINNLFMSHYNGHYTGKKKGVTFSTG